MSSPIPKVNNDNGVELLNILKPDATDGQEVVDGKDANVALNDPAVVASAKSVRFVDVKESQLTPPSTGHGRDITHEVFKFLAINPVTPVKTVTDPVSSTSPFVKFGKDADLDNPFQINKAKAAQRSHSEESSPTTRSARRAAQWREKNAEKQRASASSLKIRKNPLTPAALSTDWRKPTVSPKEAMVVSIPPGTVITKDNAQSYYPSSAVVFIANLNHVHADAEFDVELASLCKKYGQCWIKIRRNNSGMPMSWAQFTNNHDAHNCMVGLKGHMLFGREIRTEISTANPAYHVSRKDNLDVTVTEAKSVLEQFGPISSITTATAVEVTAFDLCPGLVVKFAVYEHGRNAYTTMRDDDTYALRLLKTTQTPMQKVAGGMRLTPGLKAAASDSTERSIFVGNLPVGVSVASIQLLCKAYGPVVDIHVHVTNSILPGGGINTYAFVEYIDRHSIHEAIEQLNGQYWRGKTLKAAPKHADHARRMALATNGGPVGRSSTPRFTSSSKKSGNYGHSAKYYERVEQLKQLEEWTSSPRRTNIQNLDANVFGPPPCFPTNFAIGMGSYPGAAMHYGHPATPMAQYPANVATTRTVRGGLIVDGSGTSNGFMTA